MNAKNRRKGGGRPGGSRAKRPYSTIELKATEVPATDTDTGISAGKAKQQSTAGKPGDAKPATGSRSGAAQSGFAQAAGDSAFAAGSRAPKPAPKKPTPTPSQSASKSSSKADVHIAGSKSGTAATGAAKSSYGTGSDGKQAASSSAKTQTTKTQGTKPMGSKPPPPTAARAKSGGGGGGFLSHMTAGIVGAALTIFGASYASDFLASKGIINASPASALLADAQNRIAALEKALAAGDGGGANNSAMAKSLAATQAQLGKLDDLNKTIADLKASQAKLQQNAAALQAKLAKGGGATPEVTRRMSQLEQTLAALGAAAKSDPKNAGRIPQLAAISGRVNDLETTLQTRLAELRKDVILEIDNRVSSSSEASEAAKSGTQRLDRDVNALRTGSAKMDQRLIELNSANNQTRDSLRVVQQATGSLKATLDGLKSDLVAKFKASARPADVTAAVAPLATRLGSLEQNLQGVVKSEASRKSTARRIVLALELGNLKRAMDRGQSFEAELAEVKRVARGGLKLGALEDHKSSGVPTLGDLQSDFRKIAYKMIDAATMKENAGVMDQLLRGAKSIIRVRKVNHSPGDSSVEAIVGRMDVGLKDGRLSDVLKAAAKLPEKSLAPAKNWLAKVKARQSVDSAIAGIEAELKSSLSGTSTGGKG